MTADEVRDLIQQAYSGVLAVDLVQHGTPLGRGEADDWAKVIVTMDSRERITGWVYRHNVHATIWEALPRVPESARIREEA